MLQPDWSPRLVRVIAGEVKRHRKWRGMTTHALADACAALGYPIPRSVLANLESGRREAITVPELVVLAKALEVPAIRLLYPLGTEPEVDILPGRTVDTEQAMLWFAGWHDPFKDEAKTRIGHGRQDPVTGLHEWYETGYDDAGAPIHMYAEHRQLLQEHEEAVTTVRRGLPKDVPDQVLVAQVGALRKQLEERIRAKRAEMRRRGITVLPDLPPGLGHLR